MRFFRGGSGEKIVLETLKIRNLAVIDETEVAFRPGLNILSGETGAGKSIVITAISMLLGSRASADLIREGCEEASVEGLFDVADIPWIRDRLQRLGFGSENSDLLIKRVIHRNGRNRIYVNGELATLAILTELCEGLVDLCGQHEHQSLVKPQTQLELLDRYGGHDARGNEVRNLFAHVRSLRREFETLRDSEEERSKKADFLLFQIQELGAAELQPGEDEKLQSEKRLLQSTEFRIQLADHVRQGLEGLEDANSVLDIVRNAISKARSLADMDSGAADLLSGLERSLAELEEVDLVVNRYLDSIELNPDRLQQVQERLAALANLRRKYGATVDEMLATLSRLEREYDGIGQAGDRLDEISSDLEKSEADLYKQGKALSQARGKTAKLLGESVTGELKDLKMGEAVFKVSLESKDDITEWSSWAGADELQFEIQTNAGDKCRPLGKIASGGELSRVMLAIRRVIADKGGIGVYLFDEIDAGIGGQTAFEVGRKLKSVAAYNQVICITHLPQVAAFAEHHVSVRKETKGKTTITTVKELKKDERQAELARMLGGPQVTKTSLKNASELLEMAR